MTKKEKRFVYAILHSDLPYAVKCSCVLYVHYCNHYGHSFQIKKMADAYNISRARLSKNLRYAEASGWLVRNSREKTGLPHYYFLRIPQDDELEELAEQHRIDDTQNED